MKVYVYHGQKFFNEKEVRKAILEKDKKIIRKTPSEGVAEFWASNKVEYSEVEESIFPSRFSKKTRVKKEFQNWLKNATLESSLGFKVDAGTNARNSIEDLIVSLADGDTISFRDANNEYHDLDLVQLNTLKTEIARNNIYAHEQKWKLDEMVNKATTIEELRKIRVRYVGKDFSKKEE